MTKYFVDEAGNYLGGFDGAGALATVPAGAIEVSNAPNDARQKWDGAKWSPTPPPPPDPTDELDAALTALDPATIISLAATRTFMTDLLKVLRGQAGKAGRIAGRPV